MLNTVKCNALALVTATALLLCIRSHAQSFEVASIRPVQPGGGPPSPPSIQTSPGGRLTATNVTLKRLIRWAYGIQDFQIVGGPALRNQTGYDVLAKGERGDETPEQLQRMVQTLLADRFKLKSHRDTRETAVFALTLSPDASKLKSVTGQGGPYRMAFRGCAIELTYPSGGSLGQLADFLSGQSWIEHPVVDRTGLKGVFEIKLLFEINGPVSLVDLGLEGGGAPPPPPPSPPSPGPRPTILAPEEPCLQPKISAAVQEQLGLKLVSQKGPLEVFTIDSWQEPSDN